VLEPAQLVELELLLQQEPQLVLLLLQELLEQQLHIRHRHMLRSFHSCRRPERLHSCCSLELECSMLEQLRKLEQIRSRLALACSTLPLQACT
jgi:hypothetical protein